MLVTWTMEQVLNSHEKMKHEFCACKNKCGATGAATSSQQSSLPSFEAAAPCMPFVFQVHLGAGAWV
jgi:hypothetical protein